MANVVSMKQLLEAGVHFGHQTRRWNPKMAEYIFTERNGIYIIDLQKTVKKLDEAYKFVHDVAADGGEIIFVGTKKQAQESIKEEAERCGMPYVNARWLGGKLEKYLGGITEMKKIPQAMFIVDPRKERIAVSEAIKLGLPIVAIVDTNCDPDEIDYVIPGNDDAIRAVKLIAGAMANAVIEGRDGKDTADEAAEAPAAEKKPAKKPAKKADKADKAE